MKIFLTITPMKNSSLLIILLILLSSCSHLSMDFAKRKYRSGYYVNLSTKRNLKIRQFEDLKIRQFEDLKIRQLEDLKIRQFEDLKIRQFEDLKMPAHHQSSVINQQSFLQSSVINLQSLKVISQKQNVPAYIGRENKGMKDDFLESYKSDDEQYKKADNLNAVTGTLLIIVLALIALIILGILVLIGLLKFTFIAFLLTFLSVIVLLFIISFLIYFSYGDK